MSSDLTFLTNESGKSLKERFSDILKTDARFFDCLVGYFFISGFTFCMFCCVGARKFFRH